MTSTSQPVKAGKILTSDEQEKFGHIVLNDRPCLDGILRTVDVYTNWAFGIDQVKPNAKTIFQFLHEGGKNSPGDSGRSEIKLDVLPKVTVKLPDEKDADYYDRHAGRAWLIVETINSYGKIYQGLDPTSDVSSRIELSMGSLLFANAIEKAVGRQVKHTDKKPEDKVSGYASLASYSSAKDGKAIIGVLRNSAPNLKKVLRLRRHFKKFCSLLKEVRSSLSPSKFLLKTMLQMPIFQQQELAWDYICKLFMAENPNEFEEMSSIEIQLLPFEYLVFDTDLIHWGGPYSKSGQMNIR